ncbi:cation channel sperm-associated auxiliary subunit gamma-like [Anolis sagrei]|uniref:cation channel sperm-associated auxiliary subunit gamma-like n=1 Tax=Anolis sagrei TaxID=38937 RepID=UPI00351FFF76
MWRFLVARLLLFLLHPRYTLSDSECKWLAVVNRFDNLGGDRNVFFQQREIPSVKDVFKELVDSAIDPDDKNAKYLGFPYYLKINLTCKTLNSAMALRTAHYSGLKPVVTVTFEEPTHAVRQKQEQLQIEMTGAPFRMGGCRSDEVCRMCWYTPMPFMNGSVVMDVIVASNHLGMTVDDKRFSINVNGFVRATKQRARFRIGRKLDALNHFMSLSHASRPLWHTHIRAPVLILGDFPMSKVVLLSDTGFEDYFPVEVGIDSCWIGSISCPQRGFSTSIADSIATESTLFIRQNQLVYYFVGHYPILHMRGPGSEMWTRVLNNVCVKQLNPVFFVKNNTEYVIALGGGGQEGQFFLISVQDGIVNTTTSLRARSKTVCQYMNIGHCRLVWVIFSTNDNKFILLVHDQGAPLHFIVEYQRSGRFQPIYTIPKYIPRAVSDRGYVLLLGTEQYTSRFLTPRGLAFNPFSKIFYIWGNAILQSNDMVSYIYLSNFPGDSPIKYFVMSFTGHIAFVTDANEVWVMSESSTEIKRAYPSEAWSVYNTLQVMEGSPDHDLNATQAIVTVFFDKDGMQELVYREDPGTTGKLIKRKFPLDHILTYDQVINTPHKWMTHNGIDYIRFTHRCPFAVVRFVDLPFPQRYTRMEHYRVKPPEIMVKTGFYDQKSLIVYQGLVYQLLQLHSAYHRAYADPVHDPTWRWWKNKKQDAEYYYYMASNWKSSGGIYVDMANYMKIYDIMPNNLLPKTIYLDKEQTFLFSVYLSLRTTKQSMGETAEENSLNYMWLTILLSHPEYVHADLERHELISRGSILYKVSISDSGHYPMQQLSGKELLKSSANLKVAHSGMNCYHYMNDGPVIKGSDTISINIGCPPGRRLAFDITYTKNYTTEKNKRYFDCVKPDPEMPCFYFSDVFYPFFLIQDMVTGHSGRFNGSYIFTVIGGGAFSVDNIEYFKEEDLPRYNTMIGSVTNSLIWLRADGEDNNTDAEGFNVFSQDSSGILWVCQKNSPCHDIVPNDASAPEYFFVMKVSNRGVDQTTYCDYALEFIIHVHGLRLSYTRALFLLEVSMGVIFGMLILYIMVLTMAPTCKSYFGKLMKRMEEALVFRTASSLTFTSSFTSQSSLHHMTSDGIRGSLVQHSSRSNPAEASGMQ